MQSESVQNLAPDSLGRALGWFSVALGSAELIAPATMARLIGVPYDPKTASLMRAMGAREVGHGIAILTRPGTAGPVWSRVAGDAADLAFLGSAFGNAGADRNRLITATAAVAGVTVLDVVCAQRLTSRTSSHPTAPDRVVEAITINRPIEQVFSFWQRLENLPRFMRYLESVERLPDGKSRWRARGPGGVTVEWLAETVSEHENALIEWRSVAGASVENRGTVRFNPAPGARGTEVHVDMHFRAPAGKVGRTIAWLTGRAPSSQLHQDLQRFKQLLETGEIAVSEGIGLRRPGQPTGDARKVRTLAGVN
jgi:uncharacterized membrane protein